MIPHHDEASYDELQRTAARVRARVASTLESLDRRRHDLFNWKGQVREHAGALALAGAGAALLLLGGGAAAALRARQHRRHPYQARARALVRLWRHPELVGKRSISLEVGHRVVVGLVSAAVLEVGKGLIKQAVRSAEGTTAPAEAAVPRVVRPQAPPWH